MNAIWPAPAWLSPLDTEQAFEACHVPLWRHSSCSSFRVRSDGSCIICPCTHGSFDLCSSAYLLPPFTCRALSGINAYVQTEHRSTSGSGSFRFFGPLHPSYRASRGQTPHSSNYCGASSCQAGGVLVVRVSGHNLMTQSRPPTQCALPCDRLSPAALS